MNNSLKHLFFILLTIFLLDNIGFGQDTGWKNYSFGDEVYCMAEEDSFLWVGTNVGLIMFNKKDRSAVCFDRSNSPLTNDQIRFLAIDKFHNKWIVTTSGLYRFKNENWKLVYKPGRNYITALCTEKDSIIWFFADSKPRKFVNSSIVILSDNLPEHTEIKSMTFDKNGSLYAGTHGDGIFIYDGKNWEHISSKKSKLPDDYIVCLFADKKNGIWIGTESNGIIIYNGKEFLNLSTIDSSIKTFRFIYKDPLKDLMKNNTIFVEFGCITKITDIVAEDSNTVWVGTQGAGLIKINGNKFKIYNESNSGLLTNFITSIAIDRNGNKWIGISRRGVARFKD